MDVLCDVDDVDEYSLHHEFSDAITENDEELVEAMRSFLSDRPEPFGQGALSNVVTEMELTSEDVDYILSWRAKLCNVSSIEIRCQAL